MLAHIDDLLRRVLEPGARPSRDDDVAHRGEIGVQSARVETVSVADRIERLRSRAGDAAEVLAGLQVPVAGDLLLHFGTTGQHPTHLWADGLVHELLVHRVFDLEAGPPLPASVAPAVAWLVSALPQVALDGLRSALTAPVAIRVGPPVEVPFTLWRVGDGVGVGDAVDGPRAAHAVVTIDPIDLLRCTAGRSSWRDHSVQIDGDAALASRLLDAARL